MTRQQSSKGLLFGTIDNFYESVVADSCVRRRESFTLKYLIGTVLCKAHQAIIILLQLLLTEPGLAATYIQHLRKNEQQKLQRLDKQKLSRAELGKTCFFSCLRS